MFIISKFKDYYDYLTNTYGIDEKKVLDRRKSYEPSDYQYYNYLQSDTFVLYFCGTFYRRFKLSFFNSKIEKLHRFQYDYKQYNVDKFDKKYFFDDHVWIKLKNIKNVVNNYPYYISTNVPKSNDSYGFVELPNLGKLNVNEIISPKDAFLQIQEYISYKEPEIINDPTNMDRFVGKGFDKKTSFRKL